MGIPFYFWGGNRLKRLTPKELTLKSLATMRAELESYRVAYEEMCKELDAAKMALTENQITTETCTQIIAKVRRNRFNLMFTPTRGNN